MANKYASDVADTYVFDGRTSRKGHAMNTLFMSLRDGDARSQFVADGTSYCALFGLSREQTTAVLDRDWNAMLNLGGSIFYIYKLAMMDGLSMQYLGGVFTGMGEEAFKAVMLAGGRTNV